MRLILDCDPGNGVPGADVDDGLAIAYALASPEARVDAVTIVAGNASQDDGLASAATTLRHAGRSDVALHRGAAVPVVEEVGELRARLDARAGQPPASTFWESTPRPDTVFTESAGAAASALAEIVCAHPGEVTVVALGPLTNVALACRLEPRWAEAVARIVVMGGAVAVPGIRADLNFGYDPEAAQMVLRSGARIDVVPLDVTMQTTWNLAHNDALRTGGHPLLSWLAETGEPWIRWVVETRGLSGCWLHDPLAVAVALDETLVGFSPMHVDVELAAGPSRGATIAVPADHRGLPLLQKPAGEPNARVATAVDAERFSSLLNDRLFSFAATHRCAGVPGGSR
jgi:inosine-uridine nucleoside N-ribohydrolase